MNGFTGNNLSLKVIFFVLMILFSLVSCQRRFEYEDLSTNGFINDGCYQAIVEIKPALENSSLVKMRNSVSSVSELEIEEAVYKNIYDYYAKNIAYYSRNKGNKNIIRSRLREYVRDGSVAHKYYSENKGLILIYRIYRKELKREMDLLDTLKENESKK
jgi:hypothetical protein